MVKRAFDIGFALTALLLLAPALVLIAAAVCTADFRSPIFAGRRVGRGGGEFRMFKFRSMFVDAWKSGVNSTASDDARITWIGRWLRLFKLDELPQLVNVLRGEMSLVGPRPQVRSEAELYTAEERRLFDARPGLTDLASIVFADEGEILRDSRDPDLDYNRLIRPWKSRLGLIYIDRRSFSLDCRIVWWTALAMVWRRRALDQVAAALGEMDVDEMTVRMAARRETLVAYAPPGATEIVESDRVKAMTA